jgi:hypothetical protein
MKRRQKRWRQASTSRLNSFDRVSLMNELVFEFAEKIKHARLYLRFTHTVTIYRRLSIAAKIP